MNAPPPTIPLRKIEMLERSLRCFTLGLIGLVPILGLPAALFALVDFSAVVGRARGQWNAAARYANWGCFLGGIGVLLSFIFLAVLVIAIVSAWSQ